MLTRTRISAHPFGAPPQMSLRWTSVFVSICIRVRGRLARSEDQLEIQSEAKSKCHLISTLAGITINIIQSDSSSIPIWC